MFLLCSYSMGKIIINIQQMSVSEMFGVNIWGNFIRPSQRLFWRHFGSASSVIGSARWRFCLRCKYAVLVASTLYLATVLSIRCKYAALCDCFVYIVSTVYFPVTYLQVHCIWWLTCMYIRHKVQCVVFGEGFAFVTTDTIRC